MSSKTYGNVHILWMQPPFIISVLTSSHILNLTSEWSASHDRVAECFHSIDAKNGLYNQLNNNQYSFDTSFSKPSKATLSPV